MDDHSNASSRSTELAVAFDEEYKEAGLRYDDVRILSQFALGAILIVAEEGLGRLRASDQELKASADQRAWSDSLDDDTALSLARYLAVGMFTHGQRWAISSAQNGLMLSLATAQWVAKRFDSLTAGPLMRPLRRPVESRMRSLGNKLTSYIRTGKQQEHEGRLLVNEAAVDIVGELVDYLSESPEVASMVGDVVGGQSASMAGAVRDNSRQVSAAADTAAERVVRKILRMTPRKDLPPSPLAGHAQTMYKLDSAPNGGESHDE